MNLLRLQRVILQDVINACDSYSFVFPPTLLIIQIFPHSLSNIPIGGNISHFQYQETCQCMLL